MKSTLTIILTAIAIVAIAGCKQKEPCEKGYVYFPPSKKPILFNSCIPIKDAPGVLKTITAIDSNYKHDVIPRADTITTRLPIGAIYYCRWGAYNAIRRYKVIDYNDNGYYVKWQDAREWDSKSVEFQPIEIVNQKEFKIIK